MSTLVKITEDISEIEKQEPFYINIFNWNDDVIKPFSFAKMIYLKNKGLFVRFKSYEKNPMGRFKKDNTLVYKDSCFEFFIAPDINKPLQYMNIEVNFRGAVFVQSGANTNETRFFLNKINNEIKNPKADITVGKDKRGMFWQCEYIIPEIYFTKLYNLNDIKEGFEFKANLYKCREGKYFHHASWAELDRNKYSFHMPEFFKEIELF